MQTIRRYATLSERRIRDAAVRLRFGLASDPSPLDRTQALSKAARADRILFVCLGNICRSPLAERYARNRLAERGSDVTVDSAGFVTVENRPSPENAIHAARDYGVELTDHRSKSLTAETLDGADVTFVMDVRNFREIKSTYGAMASDVYFLKPLADGSGDDFEIPDPAGESIEVFGSVFEQISDAVDALVDRAVTSD